MLDFFQYVLLLSLPLVVLGRKSWIFLNTSSVQFCDKKIFSETFSLAETKVYKHLLEINYLLAVDC